MDYEYRLKHETIKDKALDFNCLDNKYNYIGIQG